jgi:tagatose 1,6-diphosphate aldolase
MRATAGQKRNVQNNITAQMTPGKLKGLKAVSDERGVIAALALDQRGILKKAIAHVKGVADVPDSAVIEFKKLVTAALTKHASAILLDPEYGLPASQLRNRKGLFVAYEKSCYGAPLPRMPELYETWSVRRLKNEVRADCIKVLLHYTPFDDSQINEKKKTWIQRVGDECRANDIPFVLEILGYSATGEDEKGLSFAQHKPRMVALSVEEFSKPEYGVDMLKIEVPVEMRFVPGTSLFSGEQAYSLGAAQQSFRNIDSATSRPYVYLSAGVTNQQFVETLEFAAESGSRFNGVLCGRATWQDGIHVFAQRGATALEEWLETQGTQNIRRVNQLLKSARPWTEKFDQPAYARI